MLKWDNGMENDSSDGRAVDYKISGVTAYS